MQSWLRFCFCFSCCSSSDITRNWKSTVFYMLLGGPQEYVEDRNVTILASCDAFFFNSVTALQGIYCNGQLYECGKLSKYLQFSFNNSLLPFVCRYFYNNELLLNKYSNIILILRQANVGFTGLTVRIIIRIFVLTVDFFYSICIYQ